MKTCPRCNRTYPDSENFCEADRTQLVSSPAFTQQSGSAPIECPVCGGKAEPGEIICNFCGARLDQSQSATPPPLAPTPRPSAPPPSSPTPYPRLGSSPTSTQPPMTARMPAPNEPNEGRSGLGVVGYVVAAIVALAAGAWFAIHLSSQKTEEAAVTPSSPAAAVSPAPGASPPIVTLANAMAVQVSGPGASAKERSAEAVRKAFDDNSASLMDTYTAALASDPKIADGMLIRLHFRPDGTVGDSAVRTSTSPDPSLDAKAVAAMAGWKLPATSGGDVDADYPVIFAHDTAEEERLESELQSKVASLSPSETPEYAAAPAPEASPAGAPSAEAAAGSPSAAASPAAAPSTAVASAPGPEVAKPRHRHREPAAPAVASAPSLFDQVTDRLKTSPKLRRVKAYTNGGTVTLFGKVFGEEEKSYAEETVRNIPGVTSVVDNITTDESTWAQQQTRISQQLANAGLDKVTVKVIGHDAFLDGEVKTDLEKSRAVTVAEAAAPVTVRENLIRVVPGNMFGF